MTKAEATPPRSNNNYAHPHHLTPITSIKRPRGRLSKTPPGSRSSNAALSPMHPPRPDSQEDWAQRKADDLFAPVLTFLNSHEEVTSDSILKAGTEGTDETCSGSTSGDEDSMCVTDLEDDDFNPWQFIKHIPDYSLVKHLCPRVTIPPKDPDAPPLTLVLDLDETLVHCTIDPIEDYDLVFGVNFHGQDYQVYVRLRPHLQTFLDKIQGRYEVIIFTASQKVYANTLLDRIDPEGKYFQHRLFRESCLAVEGNFLKDLNVLGRDLSKTILVDNSPHAFGYQIDNGVPIESWFEDPNDRELLKLERFLRQLDEDGDVREHIRAKFQCHRLVSQAAAYSRDL